MKKWAYSIVYVIIISCVAFSCKQSKSLQELLQEERKAIDRFINMNDLVILKDYPKNGVFEENEYFRTTDGLFFHVVDSGNGTRAQILNDISVRFDYWQYIKSVASGDTTMYYFPDTQPFSFVFGIPQTYSSSYYQCSAWVIPLFYVGENAVLDLIIPSSIGASSNNNSVLPVFYKNLRYTRFN